MVVAALIQYYLLYKVPGVIRSKILVHSESVSERRRIGTIVRVLSGTFGRMRSDFGPRAVNSNICTTVHSTYNKRLFTLFPSCFCNEESFENRATLVGGRTILVSGVAGMFSRATKRVPGPSCIIWSWWLLKQTCCFFCSSLFFESSKKN